MYIMSEPAYTKFAPLKYSHQPVHRAHWLQELIDLLAFPTISAMPAHRRDIEAAAHWLKNHLAIPGLQHAQVLAGVNGGHLSVYADWLLAPGQPTLLLFGHYDVQPVDPLKEWRMPPGFTAAGWNAKRRTDLRRFLNRHFILSRHRIPTKRVYPTCP